MSTNNQLVFVYGTLMQDFSNVFAKKLRQNAFWRGKASFTGQLFDLGDYPGATYQPQATTYVYGEVWELNDFEKTITALDRYEGIHVCNPEYVRQEVPVMLENEEIVLCWIYLFCKPIESFKIIPHGDYRKWLIESKQHL
jgi:gamma-glutamylcyclotransferase (GGCT)/AIG2-like uncharacterized protein YtfP